MTAKLLDGRELARRIRAQLADVVSDLVKKGHHRPHLVSLQVGDDQVSDIYVRNQQLACRKAGIMFSRLHLDSATTQADLIQHIRRLSDLDSVSGIILQMPVPASIHARDVQKEIPAARDVEGVSRENIGALVHGDRRLPPCTPAAVMELLNETHVPLEGKRVCVVGHSEIVGKPLTLLLLDRNATTTVCHKFTENLASHTREADVLVSATGVPELIKADMVKPGAVVIDVGFSTVPELDSDGNPLVDEQGKPRSRVCGDVDFAAVREVASWITPVPGGVGPLTTATLMRNTVVAAGGPELDLGI
ncbi:MAG: bifunctional 5,10-methylenetetrahydrofolate dehydrogenase/5,10-methenyltetrahydrofolate cyclohydrolase [Planctomycetota bacterium]